MGLFDFFRIRKSPRASPPTALPPAAAPALGGDARVLLAEIAGDPKGELVKIRVPGQIIWDTNGKQFVDEKGPGKPGRWKAAVEELVAADLIGPIGMRPYQLYLITRTGAQFARSVNVGALN